MHGLRGGQGRIERERGRSDSSYPRFTVPGHVPASRGASQSSPQLSFHFHIMSCLMGGGRQGEEGVAEGRGGGGRRLEDHDI